MSWARLIPAVLQFAITMPTSTSFPVGRNDDGSAALLRQLEVRAELLERPEQLFWANRRQLGHRGPY